MEKIKAKIAKNRSKPEKETYAPSMIEPKWQSVWQKSGIYQPDLASAKSPFYNLMMFPYPSAEGLHIGGVRTFSGVDIYGRYKRMKGNEVFEPFGLDGFGIHAENYALKIGEHPMEHAKVTEKNFYRQIREAGISVDWSRTVETYKPEYYKWTQWLFVQLFKAGLAYRKKSPVNFCPSCKTVLADEQIIDGKCERCGSVVEKRNLEQWFFRITNYADRLLRNIEKLNWTEKVKLAQKNWIGRSEGARIEFKVQSFGSAQDKNSIPIKSGSNFKIEVFTTRPDTLVGATFLVVSPEHPFVASIPYSAELEAYIKQAVKKTDQERLTEGKEKTGVFSGAYAINLVNNQQIPIWIADYVLMGYGTGAIMAVPAHDQRDFEFAKKYNLPIKQVIAKDRKEELSLKEAYIGPGKIINSGEWDGLEVPKEIGKVVDWLEEKGYGRREVTYHLRDWLISRQRYWGPPIPMIYCEKCAREGKGEQKDMPGWYAVPEKDLPVKLPYLENYKPLGIHSASSGQVAKGPLASDPKFYKVKCPYCGSEAIRETDVSDTFLDSAWYFLRYTSTDFDDRPFDKERVKKWLPVTMYIGGAEHSVLHLLYARFITMFLYDQRLVPFDEPFARFYAHGLIIKEGAKMSKSKGNVVTPDEYSRKYGADTLRMYLHFLVPFNQEGDFRDTGIEGMNRFLKRVWKLFSEFPISNFQFPISKERNSMLHKTIRGVTDDMENLRYNTAIAKLMTYYNFLSKLQTLSKDEAEAYLKLLAPFAPHMTEELWEKIGNKPSIHTSTWPVYDASYLEEETVKIPVQVNGKLRGTLELAANEIGDETKIELMAKEDERIAKFLDGRAVKKMIYVPGKVLNFVVDSN